MTETVLAHSHRLVHAFRRRRRLRTGAVQSMYVAIGLGVALVMPSVRYGPQIDESRFGPVLVALAGGLVSFIALVFSLLFLVVQYGNTALSPRLNLFRDSPLIWHAFGVFVGVFVFCATSAVALSGQSSVPLLIPALTVLLIVVCLVIMRRLQFNAFRSLQLGDALSDISAMGRRILIELYHDRPGGEPPDEYGPTAWALPPVATTVTWPDKAAVLRQVDVPLLVSAAAADEVVIEMDVRVGDPLIEDRPVLTVHGHGAHDDPHRFLQFIETGIDRTFDQDPLLAFRLLSDIGLRALSPAINDPATAIQVLDHSESLLGKVVTADLTPRPIVGADGDPRVLLRLPTWEEYLEVAVDEVAFVAREVPSVDRRVAALLVHLHHAATPSHMPALDRRIAGARM